MAKEKKGEEVDTRRCGFEGLWARGIYLFSAELRLMHGKVKGRKEADIGIVVALPFAVERATIRLKYRANRRG